MPLAAPIIKPLFRQPGKYRAERDPEHAVGRANHKTALPAFHQIAERKTHTAESCDDGRLTEH